MNPSPIWWFAAVTAALLATAMAWKWREELSRTSRTLHRYRTATATAYRWLGGLPGAGETALWIGNVGEGSRGLDIERFREEIRAFSPTAGAKMIADERNRQISGERYSEQSDRGNPPAAMAMAAVCYAVPAHLRAEVLGLRESGLPVPWPETFTSRMWKPLTDPNDKAQRIRELEKAGALIAAEIDRLIWSRA